MLKCGRTWLGGRIAWATLSTRRSGTARAADLRPRRGAGRAERMRHRGGERIQQNRENCDPGRKPSALHIRHAPSLSKTPHVDNNPGAEQHPPPP